MHDTPPTKKQRLDESQLSNNLFEKARLKYSKKNVADVIEPKISAVGVINAEKLSTRYDAWLMQCPTSVNVNSFLGKSIDLQNTTRVKPGRIKLLEDNHKMKYNINVISGNSTINCVLPSKLSNTFKTTVVSLSGNIILQENKSSREDDTNTQKIKKELEIKEEPEVYEKRKKNIRKSMVEK